MRTFTTSANALLLLVIKLGNAKHGVHEHLEALHARHYHHREHARAEVEAFEEIVKLRSVVDEAMGTDMSLAVRQAQCVFPSDAGLVPVTPGEQNAGWAMSPNQPCLPGNYCPYACPPGQVSMQWNPAATSYVYPLSMVS